MNTIARSAVAPNIGTQLGAMRFRAIPIVGLVVSIPLHLVHHFTWVPGHIGASSGLTVEVTDLWVIWLLFDYMWAMRTGHVNRQGFGAICALLAFWLIAGLLSLSASSDITLSLYGILAHLRVAVFLVTLALTMARGKYELRAACLGVLLAVSVVGGICLAETLLGTNLINNAGLDAYTENNVFRAAGLNTPTLTAGYLATLLPLIGIELVTCRGLRRLLAFAALLLGLVGIVCTLTRGVWGCMLIGSLPLLGYLFRRRLIRPRFVVVCATAAVLVLAALGDRITVRFGEGNGNLSERGTLIKTALNMASSSPLVGVGLNTYVLHMYEFTPKNGTQDDFVYLVHNEFALALAETGVVGLAATILLLVLTSIRASRLARAQLPLAARGASS